MTEVVYMDDPSQPMRGRCYLSFFSYLFLPQIKVSSPGSVYSFAYSYCKRRKVSLKKNAFTLKYVNIRRLLVM